MLDPRQDAFAGVVESLEAADLLLGVPGDAERVGAVAAVRSPRTHLVRVEAGLGAADGGAGHARRLAGDRVGAVRVSQVVMEGQPEAGAGAGRASGEGDLRLIEVPFLGLAARELEGAGAVEHRSLHRRHESVGGRVLDRAIFDRDDRDARFQGGLEHRADDRAIAAGPAAAMDVEEQRRGLVRLRPPEVDPLHAMRTVGDVLVRLDRQRVLAELRVDFLGGCGDGLDRRLGRRVGAKEGEGPQAEGEEGEKRAFHFSSGRR